MEEDEPGWGGGVVGHVVREGRQGQMIQGLMELLALTLSELGSHCRS